MAGESNGSGAKAFGGIMAIGALATFGWMLWQSQSSSTNTLERLTNQRVQNVENSIAIVNAHLDKINTHALSPAHPVAIEWNKAFQREIEELRERMREDDQRELADAGKSERINEQLREIETQFRHMDRLIQLLWHRVYDEPLPDSPTPNGNGK